jgi:hypothetical protein
VHRCGDVVDELPIVTPWENCGGCGEIKHTGYLGQTTLRDPCDDCKGNGAWVEYDGEWMEKAAAEAAAAAAAANA